MDNDETLGELRSEIFDEIEDIAPEKAEKYKRIAEEYRGGHHMLPAGAIGLPVGVKEIREAYELELEKENTREIAERTVLIYFLNEGILTENILDEELDGNPSSFVEHLRINACEGLQKTICKLYEKIHPHEWSDHEQDVRESLEIPENSEFPSGEVAQ